MPGLLLLLDHEGPEGLTGCAVGGKGWAGSRLALLSSSSVSRCFQLFLQHKFPLARCQDANKGDMQSPPRSDVFAQGRLALPVV